MYVAVHPKRSLLPGRQTAQRRPPGVPQIGGTLTDLRGKSTNHAVHGTALSRRSFYASKPYCPAAVRNAAFGAAVRGQSGPDVRRAQVLKRTPRRRQEPPQKSGPADRKAAAESRDMHVAFSSYPAEGSRKTFGGR